MGVSRRGHDERGGQRFGGLARLTLLRRVKALEEETGRSLDRNPTPTKRRATDPFGGAQGPHARGGELKKLRHPRRKNVSGLQHQVYPGSTPYRRRRGAGAG